MSDTANDEAIALFCQITSAPQHVAEHYLSAHDWDLNRSVEFYLEHPAEPEDPLERPYYSPEAAPAGEPLQPTPQHVLPPAAALEDDDELQRALAESLRPTGPPPEAGTEAQPVTVADSDDEVEELNALAQMRQESQAASRAIEEAQDDMPTWGSTRPASTSRHRAAVFPAAGTADRAVGPAPDTGFENGIDEALLPEGINVEEARMLEAAYLGIPYSGRIPNFTQTPSATVLDPGSVALHQLRQEQDEAYEESLRADRAKAEHERRERETAEAAQAAREAAELAAAQTAAEKEARKQASLARKRTRLEQEPDAGAEGVLTVLARMPDGTRLSRRFLKGDRVQLLYDFVDVKSDGALTASGGFSLVMPFPRKVLDQAGQQTLQELGLEDNQVLLVQPL